MHPFSVLLALKTYSSGGGYRGSLTWNPVSQIVDALDEAFYKSFNFVEPTNANIMLAVDVSGSMMGPAIGNLTCAEASAALAMTVARTEPNHVIMGFSHKFKRLDISPKLRFDAALKRVRDSNFGGTDCALPMLYAKNAGLDIDAFVVITDNETWAGATHPAQALNSYREKSGRPAKLVVLAMTATDFSIADPNDKGMLDIAGLDAAVPILISDFIRGL